MENECKKCGHKWFKRLEREPLRCPGCSCATWDGREDKRVHNRGSDQRVRPTRYNWEGVGLDRRYEIGLIMIPEKDRKPGLHPLNYIDTLSMGNRYNSMMAYGRKSGKAFGFECVGAKYWIWRTK